MIFKVIVGKKLSPLFIQTAVIDPTVAETAQL